MANRPDSRAAGWLIHGCLWLCLAASLVARAGDDLAEAALVKAAFVYNFAKFTRWPESALAAGTSPLRLCLAGEDAVTRALEKLRDNPVKNHPLTIVPLRSGPDPQSCHLLYVASPEQKRVHEWLRLAQGQATLTIAEIPRFAHQGGTIELVQDRGRVLFTINLGVARASRLEISPDLLKLARVIGLD